jgi:hypothetical protein
LDTKMSFGIYWTIGMKMSHCIFPVNFNLINKSMSFKIGQPQGVAPTNRHIL